MYFSSDEDDSSDSSSDFFDFFTGVPRNKGRQDFLEPIFQAAGREFSECSTLRIDKQSFSTTQATQQRDGDQEDSSENVRTADECEITIVEEEPTFEQDSSNIIIQADESLVNMILEIGLTKDKKLITQAILQNDNDLNLAISWIIANNKTSQSSEHVMSKESDLLQHEDQQDQHIMEIVQKILEVGITEDRHLVIQAVRQNNQNLNDALNWIISETNTDSQFQD